MKCTDLPRRLFQVLPTASHRRPRRRRPAFECFVEQLDERVLLSTPSIGDPDFDQVVVGAGNFQYDPTGSPWTFAGKAGISGNGSGFTAGNPNAPDGAQVAFIQTTGSFSQSVANWTAGSYTVSFETAQRGNYNLPQKQNFAVLIDGSHRRHVHALRHVIRELFHPRLHRRRRNAYNHIPRIGQCRRRQYRLPGPGRRGTKHSLDR